MNICSCGHFQSKHSDLHGCHTCSACKAYVPHPTFGGQS